MENTLVERAGRLLSKLKPDSIPAENLARSAWAKAVGKVISAHTQAAGMVRERLIIDVEDSTWQRQLVPLTSQILSKLEKVLGPGIVGDLEFRVAPLRMKARKETPLPLFEQALPEDPIFRHVFLSDLRRRRAASAAAPQVSEVAHDSVRAVS